MKNEILLIWLDASAVEFQYFQWEILMVVYFE